jgi:ribosomal protein L29
MESLGRQERQELYNRLGLLLGHLLKWRFQPEARSKSWTATIREQRREIEDILADNPSLKPYLAEAMVRGYQKGLDLVNRKTPLNPDQLPRSCPFSEAEMFDQPIELGEL